MKNGMFYIIIYKKYEMKSMTSIYRMLFEQKKQHKEPNENKEPSEPNNEKNEEPNEPSKNENKQKKEKCCSYCCENKHNISKCEKMNDELNKITEYCSHYENQTNIPKTKEFLKKIDNVVIKRYVKIHKIRNYMYHNCSQYYDNIEKNNNNIELIIGYLCVLPLHPELKIKRTSTKKVYEQQPIQRKHNNFNAGLFVGPQGVEFGVGLGYRLY